MSPFRVGQRVAVVPFEADVPTMLATVVGIGFGKGDQWSGDTIRSGHVEPGDIPHLLDIDGHGQFTDDGLRIAVPARYLRPLHKPPLVSVWGLAWSPKEVVQA